MSTVEHHATESHHLPPEQVADQQRKAVLFFILADAVVFGSLLFSYFYLRSLNVNGGWLPDGVHTAPTAPLWIATALTLASAIAYRMAEGAIRKGNRSGFTGMGLVALVLVLASLAAVIYQMMTWNILMSDGTYASMFIVMTGVQLVHLVLLLIVGLGIWNRGVRGLLDGGHYNHATVVGYFWYWVTLCAVLGACTSFFTQP